MKDLVWVDQIRVELQALVELLEKLGNQNGQNIPADFAAIIEKSNQLRALVIRKGGSTLVHSIIEFARFLDQEWIRFNLKAGSSDRISQALPFLKAYCSRLGMAITAFKTNPDLQAENFETSDIIRKVLIVEDTKIVQWAVKSICELHPGLKVIGMASNVAEARAIMEKTLPDAIILDVQMPGVDGLTFVRELGANCPIPCIVVSSLGADRGREVFNALYMGVSDFIQKGNLKVSNDIAKRIYNVATSSLESQMRFHMTSPRLSESAQLDISRPILIGASIGSTRTLLDTLAHFQKDIPPILITQKIVPGFSPIIIRYLQERFPFAIEEAQKDQPLRTGVVLLAPEGYQMTLCQKVEGIYQIQLTPLDPDEEPSLDLFFSSAKTLGKKAIGLLLSGSSSDGARGLLDIRKAGGYTLVQREEDCIDPELPRAAIRLGAATCTGLGENLGPILAGILRLNSEDQVVKKKEEPKPTGEFQKPRCLLVDDSPLIRKVIKNDLKQMFNFEFEEAENGLVAWHVLELAAQAGGSFSIVVCDQNMPEMTGRELLKKVRESDKLKDIPFIIATSEGEREGLKEAISLGVSDFVVKPVSGDLLRAKVKALLLRSSTSKKPV